MEFIEIISVAGYAIEAMGVLVVVIGSVLASGTFIRSYRQLAEGAAYRTYRRQLGPLYYARPGIFNCRRHYQNGDCCGYFRECRRPWHDYINTDFSQCNAAFGGGRPMALAT